MTACGCSLLLPEISKHLLTANSAASTSSSLNIRSILFLPGYIAIYIYNEVFLLGDLGNIRCYFITYFFIHIESL